MLGGNLGSLLYGDVSVMSLKDLSVTLENATVLVDAFTKIKCYAVKRLLSLL